MEVSLTLVRGRDQKMFQVVLLLLLAPALTSCRVAEFPADCSQVSEVGGQQQSGPYSIYPAGEKLGVQVYCEMSPDQPAWTVIQTRMDGTVNFYRPWTQYKVGFGSVTGEHWLGLDNLHYLTSGPTKFELQVDMEDFEGNKASAHYRIFSVDSECNGYTLTVSGFTDKGAGLDNLHYLTSGPTKFELQVDMEDFEGNKASAHYRIFSVDSECNGYTLTVSGFTDKGAGDSMKEHNGMKFSTFDKDQDTWPDNCASTFMGGFWYYTCHSANPNGVYRWGQEKTPFAVGVIWHSWKNTYDYSVKSMVMKVRPVQPK